MVHQHLVVEVIGQTLQGARALLHEPDDRVGPNSDDLDQLEMALVHIARHGPDVLVLEEHVPIGVERILIRVSLVDIEVFVAPSLVFFLRWLSRLNLVFLYTLSTVPH